MRLPGIMSTIQLALTVVFALPLAVFGLQWLADGRPLGLAFLVVAGLMLVLPHVLTNPLDPGDVTEAVAARVGGDEKE